MDLKHNVMAKGEIIVMAIGGTLIGGILGALFGSILWPEEASFMGRVLSMWGGILLGTVLALRIASGRAFSPVQVWGRIALIMALALLLSGVALGIFTGPLRNYVPGWMLANDILYWFPFMPIIAPSLATLLVTVLLPLPSRQEGPTRVHREYPTLP